MVPRSDSVPTGSPQASQIPDWFKYTHPDLRLFQNALIVVARLNGFNLGNLQCPAGMRYSVWEAQWAHTWLEFIVATDERMDAVVREEIQEVQRQISEHVNAIAEKARLVRKGGAR